MRLDETLVNITKDEKTPERLIKMYEDFIRPSEDTSSSIHEIGKKAVRNNDLEWRGTHSFEAIFPFTSLCEHHAMPFFGTIKIKAVATERWLGEEDSQSIINRITRQATTAETIANQVAKYFREILGAEMVIVSVRAKHTCILMKTGKMNETTYQVVRSEK